MSRPKSQNRILAILVMLIFMGFVSCLRRTRRCGDEYEAKSMDAMIVKSDEFLFRDLGKGLFAALFEGTRILA
ncbi:MAG: hypothetical protein DSZ10_01210 [Sulfurovum sp.]|nr:MAG: hypothetical protein DSZ10_01210 [Sulfurovum sp.]